jgi:tRNA(Ile)-lysidine synthase
MPALQGFPSFDDLPIAVQRRCLQLQLETLGVAVEFDLVERLRISPECTASVSRSLVRKTNSADAGSPVSVCRACDGLVRLKDTAIRRDRFKSESLMLKLTGGAGEVSFGGTTCRWRISPRKAIGSLRISKGQELFDADRVGTVIRLCHWQPGDRFRPIGMKRDLKLQDFFINAKVPRNRRHELILALSEKGDVFWVEGQRIGERFKLTPRSNRILQWSWKRTGIKPGKSIPLNSDVAA